nr:fe(3+)-transport system permease protein SfuB-like [Nerophis lumbriciformis]
MIWVVPAVVTAAVVLLPLLYIFLRASQGGLAVYLRWVLTPTVAGLVGRTSLLVLGTVTVALLVAVPLAWLVARTDLPGRRAWALLAALPLVFPSYVAAFALVAALGPRGSLQSWLGVDQLPGLAYGYSGALIALGLFTYPYIYLPLVGAMRRLDPALEESARSLGAGRVRVFFTVILPQLWPVLSGGALLVALYTLSDFGAVSIVRYNTFTLSIYNAYQGIFDRTTAAALASVLVVFTLLLIVGEARLVAGHRPHRSRPVAAPERVALGFWRWPATALVALLATVNVGIPLAVVAVWGGGGLLEVEGLARVAAPAVRSLSVSALAAVCAVALSLPIAVWSVRHPGKLARWVERATFAGYALPGLVIALSLVFFTVRWARPLYQTLPLLALAYVIRFLPEATSATRGALAGVAPVFEEAARSLGRRPLEVLRTLVLPMILPGMLAGGGLVFLTSMKELPATLLLRPIGYETLASEIWSYAAEGIYSAASAPALALVLVTGPPVYWWIIRPALAEERR